jgi:precorrin isomerase
VKETNKIVQDLNMEIEAIKKTLMEATMEMDNPGKRTRTTGAGITNRIQEMEERISGIEDNTENRDILIIGNAKNKKFLIPNSQEIWGTMKRLNLRIIEIEYGKDF